MTKMFSFGDVLALIGLAQSLYLIVYILFRAGHWRNVIVPSMCFIILALAFTLDFARPRFENQNIYFLQTYLWATIPAFSVLLIWQIADLGRLPPPAYWSVLILPVVAGLVGYIFKDDLRILIAAGIVSGSLCYLFLWAGRKSFADLKSDKVTKGERYWLVLSFIVMNILIIFVRLLNLSEVVTTDDFLLIRDILGIAMVYLASTSMLRIYPRAIRLVESRIMSEQKINEQDKVLIERIQQLLDMDKVYQEANFSRADLARELNISEAVVSRLVSQHFGKSLPQLINELRVRDSLQLLGQTDVAVAIVGEQVGFSSVPTFNRVFKDVMGVSPSEYRQKNKAAI